MKTTQPRIGRPILALVAVLFAVSALPAQTPGLLRDVVVQKSGDQLVAMIGIDGAFTYETSILISPPRFVVDATPVSRIGAAPHTQINDVGVLDVRVGQYKPETARIVFDLGQRIPCVNAAPVPGGLKVTFWHEAVEAPPAAAAGLARPETKPVTTVPAAAAPVIRREVPKEEPESREPGRSGFFVSARGGLSLYLQPEIAKSHNFTLYGETGTQDDLYAFKGTPIYEIVVGKYFNRIKAGLGLTLGQLKHEGVFEMALPHPFLTDSPRAVSFESGPLTNSTMNVYAFALFSFLETESFGVWAGPFVGLASGAIQTLDDFNFSEKAPYGASDIVIQNQTYVENTYSELLFGGILNFEYRLSPMISLVLDARMAYINPKIASLGQRANLLQIQPVLGIQIEF